MHGGRSGGDRVSAHDRVGAHTATLSPGEFIGRFLLHILPDRLVKIRHFGLLASGNVTTKLERARALVPEAPDLPPAPHEGEAEPPLSTVAPALPWPAMLLAVTGVDVLRCPRCQQRTIVRELLPQARASPSQPRTA